MAHKSQRLASYRAFMDAARASNARTYGAMESGALDAGRMAVLRHFDRRAQAAAAYVFLESPPDGEPHFGETYYAPFFDPRHPQVPCDDCRTPVHEFYASNISGIGMCRNCTIERSFDGDYGDDFFYTGVVRERGNYDRCEYIQGVRHCPDCETHADTADLECRKCGADLGCASCWECDTTYCPTCGRYHEDNDPKHAADREARAIERAERMAEDLEYVREELGYYD